MTTDEQAATIAKLQERCGDLEAGWDELKRAKEAAERALAEMQAQRDVLAEAIEPFAKYGEQLRGQRVRLDTVMLELWGTKIVVEHLTQAHQALATLPASAVRYRAVVEAAMAVVQLWKGGEIELYIPGTSASGHNAFGDLSDAVAALGGEEGS
jgi:hypothetical protein